MTVTALLSQATAEGVRLRVEGEALKVRGTATAVARWRPILAPHKATILATLHADVDRVLAEIYDPDPYRTPTRAATDAERAELLRLIEALGEPVEYRLEALRLACLDPDAALECFRRIAGEIVE